MIGYQYSYLIGDLVLLIVWFILFFWRKDVRKEMLALSIIFGVLGLFVQFVYINDWWHPPTITNTKIGFEDFLLGFVTAGIASVIYEEIFKKRVRIIKYSKKKEEINNFNFILFLLVGVILFFGSFYLFKISSVHASIIAIGVPVFVIWLKRNDLIIDSLVSGLLLMIVSILAFVIPEIITPGIVKNYWFLDNLSGIIIFKAPLEDLIWFFLIGCYIGPLYEFWKKGRLVKNEK